MSTVVGLSERAVNSLNELSWFKLKLSVLALWKSLAVYYLTGSILLRPSKVLRSSSSSSRFSGWTI